MRDGLEREETGDNKRQETSCKSQIEAQSKKLYPRHRARISPRGYRLHDLAFQCYYVGLWRYILKSSSYRLIGLVSATRNGLTPLREHFL